MSTAWCHDAPESLEPELPGWRALADELGLPYCTPEWMLAFWHHRHVRHAELRVVTVKDGEELIGVVPMYRERRRGRPATMWLLASGFGQRTAPLARPGRERDVAEAAAPLLRGKDRVAALELPALPASPWPAELARALRAPRAPRTWKEEAGLLVDLADDHDGWLKARSKNFRKKHAKRHRELGAAGISVRSSTGESLAHDLDATFRLHHARFAAASRPSSITPDVEASVRAAATAMLARDACVHLVLDGPQGIVGGDVYFIAGERMCGWNGGFDPEAAELSPGTILLDEAVRVGHERRLRTLDLGAGDQPFKQRFASREEPLEWTRVSLRPAASAVLEAEQQLLRLRDRARSALTRYGSAVPLPVAEALMTAA